MKKFLIVLFLGLSLAAAASAQTQPAAKAADPALTVVNGEGKSFAFTAADLAKLSRQQIKAKDHDGKEIVFEGASVADVLKLAGVKLGGDTMRGKRLAEYLLVEAKDSYHAVFSLTEFDPEFTDTIILLADKADGKPLDEKSGPWQMIVPNQKKHARWVRQVTKLTVKTADVNAAAVVKTTAAEDKDAIYEAVFRIILKRQLFENGGPQLNYYLLVEDKKDPSDILMSRLNDLGLRLRKGSESFISEKEGSMVRDKKTKKQGARFVIYRLERVSSDEVKVGAGDEEGNMAAFSCTYFLKREGDKWVMAKAEQCVIS
jgi:hypothetical protein